MIILDFFSDACCLNHHEALQLWRLENRSKLTFPSWKSLLFGSFVEFYKNAPCVLTALKEAGYNLPPRIIKLIWKTYPALFTKRGMSVAVIGVLLARYGLGLIRKKFWSEGCLTYINHSTQTNRNGHLLWGRPPTEWFSHYNLYLRVVRKTVPVCQTFSYFGFLDPRHHRSSRKILNEGRQSALENFRIKVNFLVLAKAHDLKQVTI